MGIPGLFGKFISRNVRYALINTINNVSSLSIDLNSLLHAAFSKIYMEGILEKGEALVKEGNGMVVLGKKTKKNEYLILVGQELIKEGEELIERHKEGIKMISKGEKLQGKEDKKAEYMIRTGTNMINEKVYMKRVGKSEDLLEKLEKDYHNQVWKLIMEVLGAFENVDTLILAVDGVAPGGKLKQQRQRRFKSALNNNATVNFDSNVITPGTEFMIRLDEFLEKNINRYKGDLPRKVIYSSHLTPQEGEAKIFEYYRTGEVQTLENANHVLYGLDADLIMLSLLSPLDNIVLYRDSSTGVDMLSINLLKDYITRSMKKGSLHDFVIMTFLLGNDFLPHNLALAELAETIEMMMDVYNKGNLTFTKKNGELDFEQLQKFFVMLAQQEAVLLGDIARDNTYYSKPLEDAKENDRLNINLYRKKYYDKVLGSKSGNLVDVDNNKIKDMVMGYLRTLSWNYLYYKEGMSAVNHDWVYPYYYAPMLADLALYAKDVNIIGYKAYNGMTIFNPLHQLLSVLPKTSIDIVPDIIKPYFLITSPIYDIFPSKFINDHDGKIPIKKPGRSVIDFGIALIPIPDRSRIELTIFNVPLNKKWEEKENLVVINNKPERTAYHKYSTSVPRQMNYEPRNDLQPRQQPRQYVHHQKEVPVVQTQRYVQRQEQQYQQKQPQYQQKQQYQPVQRQNQPQYQPVQRQQYQQRTNQQYQPVQTQQRQGQQYQPQYQQRQNQYQPVQTQPQYQPVQKFVQEPMQNKYQMGQRPIMQRQYEIQEPHNDVLPKMLNVNKLKSYILTGKIPEDKKSAKEMLEEEEWY